MYKMDEPLLEASRNGQTERVEQLLAKRGTKATVTDRWNQSGLHMAAPDGHVEITKLLLARGLDVNARNKLGETPLFIAARCSAGLDYFRLLLARGADVSVRTKKGESVMDGVFTPDPLPASRRAVGKLLAAHGAPATPEQSRIVGGAKTATLDRTIKAFDWPGLEAHLLAATTKAIAAFAKKHRGTVFCAFCFDCNAQAHGEVLLCLDTPEQRDRVNATWSPGDFAFQGLYNLGGDKAWRARVAPLGGEHGIEPEVAKRLLESVARVAVRLAGAGAFEPLKTEVLDVFVRDHDETLRAARARMKRARARRASPGQP